MSSTNKRPLPPNGKHIPKRPGQWFAIMGASAPGVGLTADDASRSARAERGREPAQVAYLPPTESIESALPPEFAAQRDLLPDELDGKVWLVGGAIRDALLRRPIHDLDFAVDGDALALARRAADTFGGAYYTLDAAREIGRVLIDSPKGRVVLDYARMRGADIVEDLLERDFTINAMGVALPAGSTLLDPAGARDDLQKRMLRATTPHAIARDPLRGVRAVRFAAELGFVIERETRASIRAAAPQLAAVSPERVRDEFMRCLEGPKPAAALRALQLLGLLSTVTPEWDALPGAERETTLALVERLAAVVSVLGARHDIEAASEFALGLVAGRVGRYRVQISRRLHEELSVGRTRRGVFFLGAQLHDAGDAAARAAALRLSTAEGRWLAALVGNWAAAAALVRRGAPARRAIHRYYRAAGDAGVEACLLALAEELARRGPELSQDEWVLRVDGTATLLGAFFERHDEIVDPPPLVSGEDLMQTLGIPPGPRVGALLAAIREAQAAGEVTTREAALAFAAA